MAHLHFTFLISTMQAEKAHRQTYFHKFVYGRWVLTVAFRVLMGWCCG